jgi:hypothetical protein
MFATVAIEVVCGKAVFDKLLSTPENCWTFLATELMHIRGVVAKSSEAIKDQSAYLALEAVHISDMSLHSGLRSELPIARRAFESVGPGHMAL